MAISIEKTAIYNEKNPRVLSLSLKNNEKLQDLYEQIDRGLFEANVSNMDIRQFEPHLTLARVKKSSETKEFEAFLNWQPKKEFLFVSSPQKRVFIFQLT